VREEPRPRLLAPARAARDHHFRLTVDADESERLDLTLDLLAALCAEPAPAGWDGPGLTVHA
jgi:RHH-type proline utilization regulon transcriptional repressor/proline dehydrogenase/delta 1-pyrroline-5-carboxylate dehydrogenase